VLLAVTTIPAALDPALRRPGRLDYAVEVPLPNDLASRAAILRFSMLASRPVLLRPVGNLLSDRLLERLFNGATNLVQLGQEAKTEAILFGFHRRCASLWCFGKEGGHFPFRNAQHFQAIQLGEQVF
jgi:hypothetical protein